MSIEKRRSYGIDLLRFLSMLGVAVLHILGHGKVLNTTVSDAGFSAAWFLEILAYPAVNCFVLISGYVGYRDRQFYPKLKNLFSTFFTVLFYSVSICLFFNYLHPADIQRIDIAKAFLPVTTGQYWFFSSYFAMFLISPMLNQFVYGADAKMMRITFLAVMALAVGSMMWDPFDLLLGFSFVWFALLYVLGAIVKKTDGLYGRKLIKNILLVAGTLVVTWAVKIYLHYNPVSIPGVPFSENILVSYCSPTMLIASIGLLLIFAEVKTSKLVNRIIAFFVPSVFSVYLIHDNIYFRKYVIAGNFTFINNYDPLIIPFMVVGAALVIFVTCLLIDKVRVLLFRIVHVHWISEKLESLVKAAIRKMEK